MDSDWKYFVSQKGHILPYITNSQLFPWLSYVIHEQPQTKKTLNVCDTNEHSASLEGNAIWYRSDPIPPEWSIYLRISVLNTQRKSRKLTLRKNIRPSGNRTLALSAWLYFINTHVTTRKAFKTNVAHCFKTWIPLKEELLEWLIEKSMKQFLEELWLEEFLGKIPVASLNKSWDDPFEIVSNSLWKCYKSSERIYNSKCFWTILKNSSWGSFQNYYWVFFLSQVKLEQ